MRATPERFGEIYRQLQPPVIQVSGGEPLTRGDVEDIIRTIRQPNGLPYIILVTNGSLLTPDRFLRLRSMGVDQFSVSLDFPDERHDTFRRIPGLFGRIRDTVLSLDREDRRLITLNAVVLSANFRELTALAELAREWGVSMNYSPYTTLRTGDRGFLIKGEDLREFEDVVRQLISFKAIHRTIRTSNSFLRDMVRFFRDETRPGCRAGERFLVVNPDATLSPCGLIMARYGSRREPIEGFSRQNACGSCNTCIRAATERPLNNLVKGGLRSVRA